MERSRSAKIVNGIEKKINKMSHEAVQTKEYVETHGPGANPDPAVQCGRETPPSRGVVSFPSRACSPTLTDAIVTVSRLSVDSVYLTSHSFSGKPSSSESVMGGSVQPYRESSSRDPSCRG